MFNDQTDNQNKQSAPQDIFDSASPVPAPTPINTPSATQAFNPISASNPVNLSPVDSGNPVIHTMAGDASVLKPVNRVNGDDPWSQLSPNERAALESIRPSAWRRILVVILVVLIISGGIYVAWRFVPWSNWLSRFFPASNNSKVAPSPVENNKENNQEYLNQIIQPENNTMPTATPIDTDRDGLNDEEETQAGTKVDEPDSDNDDLSDLAEVKTYKTNPLKADSDDDGYNDGLEVKNGNNPLDARPDAKLLQINSETINQAKPTN